MIITRIPPSPTGMFHIGSLRTALYDYLLAKKEGGIFFLRIEDTDRNRLVEGAIENIVASLDWVDISSDEGVVFDEQGNLSEKGDHGPYTQSERLDIYEKYTKELLDKELAYYAFDTPEALEEMRNRQRLNKQAPRYERDTMTNSFTLGMEEAKKRIAAGEPYVVRMVIPKNEDISFTDLVRGEITVNSNEVDDQILRKSDGFPTYHLAVVVDDYLMKTTHVLRGEEWISSTPKHILLYRYFGWDKPIFAHLPVIVNKEGKKLSKRHGDVSVFSFRDTGYLPEALVNFVALLGWNPGTDQEIFTLEGLVEAFDMSKVQRKPAFFDRDKLAWFNQQYIRKMDISELTNRCLPFLIDSGLVSNDDAEGNDKRVFLEGVVALQRERITVLSELPEAVSFMFTLPQYEKDLLMWKKSTLEDAREKLIVLKGLLEGIQESDWNVEHINEKVFSFIKEKEFGTGDALWPLRIALSGQKNSPGPFDIMGVLGKEESFKRIDVAIEKLS